MASTAPLETRAESIIDILSAQCADLEALLQLARRETAAVEGHDFDGLMRVVAERATLGERLESYHRQIAEIRAMMGEVAAPLMLSEPAVRAARVIADIQSQDARTRPLLAAARDETAREVARLNASKRNTSAYLRDARTYAVACDQRA